MKPLRSRRVFASILLTGTILGCQLFSSSESEPTVTVTVEAVQTEISPTTEVPPSETAVPATATGEAVAPTETQAQPPTATSGPECVVLQSLNFRSGPGVAYRPPVRALATGTVLVPLGYNPVGVPGGSWVQVQLESDNEIGWVSGGEQFVECSIDLNSLPEINVPPPPPPGPPSVDASTPDGTVPPGWVWDDLFDPNYFVRMQVFDQGNGGTQDGDGIARVNFQVLDADGNLVWERTEETAAYCIFAGGEPNCNPWVVEDYFYKWGTGGPQVVEGTYTLLITAESTFGDFGNWNYEVFVDLPY